MAAVDRSEDDQLARWVGQVARRWAATGLSARRRLDLFSRLLARLTEVRVTLGTTTPLTSADPATFADATAQEWPLESPAAARSGGARRAGGAGRRRAG